MQHSRDQLLTTGLTLTLLVIPFIVGCQTTQPEIPLGHWSGHGSVVYKSWDGGQNSAPPTNQKTLTQYYSTTLDITRTTLDGHDVLHLEIISDRKPLPKLGNRTQLRAVLTAAVRPTPKVTLYRVVDWQFNPDPDQQLAWRASGPPFTASAIADDAGLTVQIHYADNFVDVLRFAGSRLHKSGMLYDKQQGLVHWSERLTQARQ